MGMTYHDITRTLAQYHRIIIITVRHLLQHASVIRSAIYPLCLFGPHEHEAKVKRHITFPSGVKAALGNADVNIIFASNNNTEGSILLLIITLKEAICVFSPSELKTIYTNLRGYSSISDTVLNLLSGLSFCSTVTTFDVYNGDHPLCPSVP